MKHAFHILAAAVTLVTAAVASAPAARAIDTEWPNNAQNKPSNPELWAQIKSGEKGVSSSGADGTLMKALPGCSDLAVGFTTPVNEHIPVVGIPQGNGPSFGALAVLAILFGFFFGAGAMVARNLGKHPAAAPQAPAVPHS